MHSQQPPGVVQNWSTLQCSKHNTEQCGYDHAPVTRGRMRTQFPLPHAPPPPPPRGPSAHFYWGGGSRIKARRRPPRDGAHRPHVHDPRGFVLYPTSCSKPQQ